MALPRARRSRPRARARHLGARRRGDGCAEGLARPLPALHRVAGWVAAGLKEKAATPAIDAQLPGNAVRGGSRQNQLPDDRDRVDGRHAVRARVTPSAAATVVLLGDSSADQWALDLGTIGAAHDFRVVVYVHAACPVGRHHRRARRAEPRPALRDVPHPRARRPRRDAARPGAPRRRRAPPVQLQARQAGRRSRTRTGPRRSTATLADLRGRRQPVLSLHGVPVTTNDPAACIAAYPDHDDAVHDEALKDVDPSGYDAATWAGAHAAGAAGRRR